MRRITDGRVVTKIVSQNCADIYAVICVLKIDLLIDLSRLQHPASSSTLYYRHGVGKQLSIFFRASLPQSVV